MVSEAVLSVLRSSVCALALCAAPTLAAAADIIDDQVAVPEAVETREIVLDLGAGVQLQPKFPTSREYEAVPYPIVRLRFLRLPIIGDVVTGRERALSIYPSFNFIGERSESDAAYLVGTRDVDFAVELGGGIAYRTGPFRIFGEARYGVTGHNGLVAEAGIDAIIDVFDRFELRVGPRISAATDDYMDTYFGVDTPTPFLDAFDPDAGFRDVGLAAEATYELTDNVLIHGRAGFTTYIGDAADSPITEQGSETEGTVGIGITYRFGLDLY